MMEIFSKTWEIFSKTMEIFQKTWEFFFLNNGDLFQSLGRLSKRHGAFRCNTLPRKPLLWKAWQGSAKTQS